jgi:signal transduction histidine kinase
MHDIKNLVSQLSLVARNAERHADNPAFREDMVKTLQSSVGKMNDLLARLAQRPGSRGDPNWHPVALPALLAQVVEVKARAHPPLTLEPPADESVGAEVRAEVGAEVGAGQVEGDAGQLEQLFLHLVQNAIDASAPDAPIRVAYDIVGPDVVVTIADNGKGMSPRFIRQELFQPFRSTKQNGFGIGAYEAREIARAHGGRLDVVSREGEGSIFTVALPIARAAALVAAQ